MYELAEALRRQRLIEINVESRDRAALEATYGQVWSPDELTRDFVVEGFLAPYVVVVRKQDHQRGSLEFQRQPRYYMNFVAYQP